MSDMATVDSQFRIMKGMKSS